MDADKLETIRAVYRAWDEPGGLWSAVHLFHEDIEYVNPDGAIEPGTRRGHEGMKQVAHSLETAFSELDYDVHDLIEIEDDSVLALTTFRARGRDSGAWAEVPEQHIWTVRDGKITRFAWYHDERAARRAAAAFGRGAGPRVD